MSTRLSMRAIIGAFAAMVLFVAPFAHADVSAQAVQLIPAGSGNTCAQITPRFQAYVYDGALNSFEVTVSDPTYVAVLASAGETSIPLRYFTRHVSEAGTTVHVDTQSIQTGNDLEVSMVLLSTHGAGTPLCALTVTAHVGNGESISTGSSQGSVAGGEAEDYWGNTNDQGSANESGEAPSQQGSESGAQNMGVAMQTTLEKICATTSGSTRLWTVLLAVYLLIVTATVLAQPTKPDNQSAALLGASIVMPLLVLLAIWGFAPSCRIGAWVPIASLIVAAIGCILGFKNHPQFAKIFTKPPK